MGWFVAEMTINRGIKTEIQTLEDQIIELLNYTGARLVRPMEKDWGIAKGRYFDIKRGL